MMYPFFILSAALLVFQSVSAQRTIRMNIERIISDAAVIVHGTVTNVESAVDSQTNILSTFVTIRVEENFFGVDQPSITLKMVGGKTKRSTLKFAEMPVFTTGEEIISMFFAPSKYGFTSPVGMGQGKFTVQTNPLTNKKTIRNVLNNARLFSGITHRSASALPSAAAENGTAIEAEEFSKTIRSLVALLKK